MPTGSATCISVWAIMSAYWYISVWDIMIFILIVPHVFVCRL